MTWENFINIEQQKEYFQNINLILENKDSYFPKYEDIYNAFKLTPYENIKVVIIGQDPYHDDNQAHGLAFSVLNNRPPKSLQNIFIELLNDLGISRTNANLEDWAKQGVFLINTTLTVEKHKPNSHKDIGWNIFTDNVIKEIEKKDNPIGYILLGAFAQSKKKLITNSKHYIIETSHPSFFSCNKGFFGSKIFSKTNEILTKNNLDPIIWGYNENKVFKK